MAGRARNFVHHSAGRAVESYSHTWRRAAALCLDANSATSCDTRAERAPQKHGMGSLSARDRAGSPAARTAKLINARNYNYARQMRMADAISRIWSSVVKILSKILVKTRMAEAHHRACCNIDLSLFFFFSFLSFIQITFFLIDVDFWKLIGSPFSRGNP